MAKNEQVERGSVGVALWGEIQNALSREEECSLERRQDLNFFSKIPQKAKVRWPISHGGKFDMVGRF